MPAKKESKIYCQNLFTKKQMGAEEVDNVLLLSGKQARDEI